MPESVAGLTFGVLATAVGLLGTLSWEILFLAGSPNSSPQQFATIKMWMWIALVGGLACAGIAVWLMVIDRPWYAAGVGVLPMVSLVVTMAIVAAK